MDIRDVLYQKLIDICFFAQTKLDDTFNQNSLNIPDYMAYSNDRNSSGGGIIGYVRSNLPTRRRTDLEFDRPIDTVVLGVQINNRKWAVIVAYRPPVSGLVNLSFATSTFPSSLKEAQVLPIFKKKDPLKKENYRPVSVLPSTSKVYERTKHDQLTEHCDNFLIFTWLLSGKFWMPDYSAASPGGLASCLGLP